MDVDPENPEHMNLAQQAARQLECPVCGVTGNMRFESVIVDGAHLAQLSCDTPGCPVDEVTVGTVPG